MKRSTKAIVRVITGGVISVIIWRLFRPEAGPAFAAGLFVALVGAAYGLEYIHNRKES
ncbi:MAG: hypothetical protein KGY42_06450 [Desulfobacterales bacterium]|nr:hypothetical protein [Desulfobacterales bacterium]MBS3756175.1 hypothetical protein [Desulfobacterales bacterium]